VIFVTNLFIPARFGAYTFGPIIFVRPEFKDDTGKIEHEKTHVRQFWRTLGLAGLFYVLSKKKRLAYEVEAYKVELTYHPEKLDQFATALSQKYNLGISVDDARRELTA
jgi:hypothetical protein